MPNSIHNLATKVVQNETGEHSAIVMGLNLLGTDTTDSFLDHVVEQFKMQRICSPPETAIMVITIAGDMTAERFREFVGSAFRQRPYSGALHEDHGSRRRPPHSRPRTAG